MSIYLMKKCRKCEIELFAGKNWNNSQAKLNKHICKICHSFEGKKFYKNNKEKSSKRTTLWRKNNPEYNKNWKENNPEKDKE